MSAFNSPFGGGTGTGGDGETNTAANVGTGAGLYKEKAGVQLRFKTIKAGANVTVTAGTDEVTVASTATGTDHDRKHTVTSTDDHGFPASPTATKYLRDDGTWETPPDEGGVWGSITGTLSDQTDLQTSLSSKKIYHGIEAYGAITYDNATQIITLASCTYWLAGVKTIVSTPVSVDINTDHTLTANTLYTIAFDTADGILKAFSSLNLYTMVPVCMAFWSGTALAITNETHNHTRNLDWHVNAHRTIGTRYYNGLARVAPTVGNPTGLDITDGAIYDEDIQHTLLQTAMTASARLWYQMAAGTYTFADIALPYAGASGAPQYLQTTGYTLQNVAASDFACYWIYASADIDRPIYIVPTQAAAAHNTLTIARNEQPPVLQGAGINSLTPEFKLIYRWIYKGDGVFQEATDYRMAATLPAGGIPATSAGAVTYSNVSSGLGATNVQGAIDELAEAPDGHVIEDAGTPVTQRAALNFKTGFTVTDDAGNDATDIEVAAGPAGPQGDPGVSFQMDAAGLLSGLSTYDAELVPFTYLATDTGEFYAKHSNTSADWSAGIPLVDKVEKYAVSVLPGQYARSEKWRMKTVVAAADRHTLVSPERIAVDINDAGYARIGSVEIDLAVAGNWDDVVTTDWADAANRAGKDFYIYALKPGSGFIPNFVLSPNLTYPTGYDASNSRKIGGFHCLCLNAGTITLASGATHSLSGFLTGDIIPNSVWDLLFHAVSDHVGLTYDPGKNKWIQIYLPSVSGGELRSIFNGVVATGTTPAGNLFHPNKFKDWFNRIGLEMPSESEFFSFSQQSNQATVRMGATLPGTTGGHIDTASRRMISGIGVEDCCGVYWQWGRDRGSSTKTVYANNWDANDSADVRGQDYSGVNVFLFGGTATAAPASCGSRSMHVAAGPLYLHANNGSRGVSESVG